MGGGQGQGGTWGAAAGDDLRHVCETNSHEVQASLIRGSTCRATVQ
jgi:hypothetical protein